MRPLVLAALLSVAFSVPRSVSSSPPGGLVSPLVEVLRAPAGGIQPQTSQGTDGILRMIYFTGDPGGGDIEYVQRAAGSREFSRPLRVNSQPGSTVAAGTVRGPQMAVGRDGRAYVVWFGSDQARPRGPDGVTPVLYSRLNDAGTAFEPQRCLMEFSKEVDGGLSVAADAKGDVYAVWHAQGSEPGESHRRVYLARSTDDGKTFSRERAVSPAALGACGCCGMRATVDSRGTIYILYRAAAEGVNRDMTLLVSRDGGATFESRRIAPWRLNACPMSTADLNSGSGRVFAAWETAGEIYFDKVGQESPSAPVEPAADSRDRKHPSVAANRAGWVLLTWTEGTGWKKGGSLAWQLFDPSGRPAGTPGRAPGVPVWGLPSAFADRNGNFVIYY